MNSANIVLIPKKEGADGVMDYRPISLLHSIAKILSKLLALRLRPHMQSLISINQSENARVLRLATGKDIFHDTTTISS